VDSGGSPCFCDDEDIVYLHFCSSPHIAAGDIRLSKLDDTYTAGKVNHNDPDENMPCVTLKGGIYYLDLFGVTCGFDSTSNPGSSDPVYALIGRFPAASLEVRTNDIRLTDSPTGLPACTKVSGLEEDNFKPANRLIAFNPFYLPLCATIKFSNNDKYVCGKPIYDHENDNVNVYLDLQLLPGFSEVKAGDIRLNKVVC